MCRVYVPTIGNILPVQGDTTYTVRMVITPESTSGWNRIPNVNHGADHGLYINGGTQIYPDGQGGADNYPAGEWSSLTVVTDTGGPMPTPITMVNSRAVGSRSIIGRRQCKSPLTRCSFSMTTTKNTVTLVASTRTFCSSRSKYSFSHGTDERPGAQHLKMSIPYRQQEKLELAELSPWRSRI